MKFFDFSLGTRRGSVRELAEADVAPIVAYWHQSPPAYLEAMGADPDKLTSIAKTEAKFRSALPSAPAPRRHVAMAIELESRLVAYTNAYLDEAHIGHAHVHVVDAELRRQGLASALFLRALGVYFEHYGVSGLVFLTHPESVGINGLLQSFGLSPEAVEEQAPSGMARSGVFNLYQIGRDDYGRLAPRASIAT